MPTQEEDRAPRPSSAPPPWLHQTVRSGVWTFIGAVLLVLAALWFAHQARDLIRMLILSQLLAFAVEPGVMWLHERHGWRRGAATGLILGGVFVFFLILILLMVPVLSRGVNGIARSIPEWIDKLNAFAREHLNTTVVSASGTDKSAAAVANLNGYLQDHAGDLVGAVGGAVGAVFNTFTIALFTFYLAADGPKVRRALLSRMPKERQRVLWTINEAIRQTGGYLYSRGLLALINGGLMFITLLAVGCPFALPISLFTGWSPSSSPSSARTSQGSCRW
jgi:predicted PurR-regulated permease PerM